MKTLTVVFDSECAFCRHCRDWLERQPAYLQLEFLASSSPEIERRFPGLERTDEPEELIVISDEGGVYSGPEAFIMCLYALDGYRELSIWLSRPGLRSMARGVFHQLSRSRGMLSRFLESGEDSAGQESDDACPIDQ